jgi:hypothetical protein
MQLAARRRTSGLWSLRRLSKASKAGQLSFMLHCERVKVCVSVLSANVCTNEFSMGDPRVYFVEGTCCFTFCL